MLALFNKTVTTIILKQYAPEIPSIVLMTVCASVINTQNPIYFI